MESNGESQQEKRREEKKPQETLCTIPRHREAFRQATASRLKLESSQYSRPQVLGKPSCSPPPLLPHHHTHIPRALWAHTHTHTGLSGLRRPNLLWEQSQDLMLNFPEPGSPQVVQAGIAGKPIGNFIHLLFGAFLTESFLVVGKPFHPTRFG